MGHNSLAHRYGYCLRFFAYSFWAVYPLLIFLIVVVLCDLEMASYAEIIQVLAVQPNCVSFVPSVRGLLDFLFYQVFL